MSLRIAVALVAAIALPAAGQQTQNGDTFNWHGRVPAGQWIHVKNLTGDITVGAASGNDVEVVGTKRWRRGDPSVVHFSTSSSGGDVTICALWQDGTCDERGYHSNNRRSRNDNNDVSVEFRVLVPKGVKVDVETVNGTVSIDGATAEVRANTVNGDLDVTTSGGRVNAATVNGSLRARLGRIDNDGDMHFETVNGSVIVDFSGEFGGDVDLQTVNGTLNTNFELTLSGRLDPKHLRAHIGKPGGPRLSLETVNGNVELRRR
jgi:hypothetical protein